MILLLQLRMSGPLPEWPKRRSHPALALALLLLQWYSYKYAARDAARDTARALSPRSHTNKIPRSYKRKDTLATYPSHHTKLKPTCRRLLSLTQFLATTTYLVLIPLSPQSPTRRKAQFRHPHRPALYLSLATCTFGIIFTSGTFQLKKRLHLG
jgi:hypothetical protein